MNLVPDNLARLQRHLRVRSRTINTCVKLCILRISFGTLQIVSMPWSSGSGDLSTLSHNYQYPDERYAMPGSLVTVVTVPVVGCSSCGFASMTNPQLLSPPGEWQQHTSAVLCCHSTCRLDPTKSEIVSPTCPDFSRRAFVCKLGSWLLTGDTYQHRWWQY
jgi:hypothetical protein